MSEANWLRRRGWVREPRPKNINLRKSWGASWRRVDQRISRTLFKGRLVWSVSLTNTGAHNFLSASAAISAAYAAISAAYAAEDRIRYELSRNGKDC